MSLYDETSPFTYSKSNNYIAKTLRKVNESLELNEKEIRTLSIFTILRVLDLSLNYIFYNKKNAFHLIRFLDYVSLFTSFLITLCVIINKDNVKQRSIILCIFFNIVFVCFDFMTFLFYFFLEVNSIILLLSLVVNEIWLIYTSILLYKIISKLLKMAKNRIKNNQLQNSKNSAYLRKKY